MTLSTYIQQQLISPVELTAIGNPRFEAEADDGWHSKKEAAHAHYLAHFVAGNTARELADATGRSTASALGWLKQNAYSAPSLLTGQAAQWFIA